MSPESIPTERDAELRRMLVATASAAPARSRRAWSIAAPVAAFALAGALTGAVSAAALAAPRAQPPVTVEGMINSFVHDDTELFGDPVAREFGHVDMMWQVTQGESTSD